MVSTILIFSLILLGGFGGWKLGTYASRKFFIKMLNKKLIKGAVDVAEGRTKNQYELDGKKQDVNTFIVRDKEEKDIIINLTK